ncbi:MAG: hypothetical protein IKM64_04225 [Clostridia bacterium]|nr:hypothetical protein [Clostridia bacterium]
MNSLHQTKTSVHTEKARENQRQAAQMKGWVALSSLHLYAQLLCGLCFFLYRYVSTPSYLSLLLLLLPLIAVYYACCRISLKQLLWHSFPGKCAGIAFIFCLYADAFTALAGLSGMVQELLPDYNSLLMTIAIVLCVLPLLKRRQQNALQNLALLLCIPLFLALLFVFPGSIPQGSGGNLFPLLGQGGGRILWGSLWMCGCLSPALFPLLAHPPEKNGLLARNGCLHLIAALFFAFVTALMAAYLMPFYFLARPESPGARFMLFLDTNTSLLAWSLTVCGMMLLLLVSLCCAIEESSILLWRITKKQLHPLALLPLLSLPLLPSPMAEEVICFLFPLRALLMGVGLILLSIGGKRI